MSPRRHYLVRRELASEHQRFRSQAGTTALNRHLTQEGDKFRDMGTPELLLVFILALILFGPKRLPDLARELGEALRNFRGGGPPSPMHPVPSNDSALLCRRRARKKEE
jgi:TatA/E family protein of Tat protein translocase